MFYLVEAKYTNSSQTRDYSEELLSLLKAGKIIEFLKKAVQYRQNIVLSGTTGTGKITAIKTLEDVIGPGEPTIF